MSNSADALAWALKVRGTSTEARLLLIMLALRVGDNGFIVWPSVKTLSDDCDFSEATVRRKMKELVAAKLVDVLAAFRTNGGRSSNRYRLLVRTTHYLPGGQTVEVDHSGLPDFDAPPLQDDRGGTVRLTGGPLQADRGPPCTGDRGNMNSESRTDSIEAIPAGAGGEQELDLGLPPLPTPEETEQEIIGHIERGWLCLSDDIPAVAQLRGSVLDDARAKAALGRARKFTAPGVSETDIWDAVFDQIRRSRWLCGETKPRDGRSPFRLQMTWLLELRNFTKVLEGKFEDGRDPTLPGGGTRSSISPAGQAALSVLERNRARRQRRSGPGDSGVAFGG